MPVQLISPGAALNGSFDSPAAEENYQSKKTVSAERRHGFWIGNIGLLLPKESISEVSVGLAICRLPNTPCWLVGMSNLRGNMVPIFDLSVLFDIQIEKSLKRTLLLLKLDEEWVGVYSDRLPARILLDSESKLNKIPPIPEQLHPFVHSAYQQTDIWLDWEINSFFSWVAEQVGS